VPFWVVPSLQTALRKKIEQQRAVASVHEELPAFKNFEVKVQVQVAPDGILGFPQTHTALKLNKPTSLLSRAP
jgi:hypothetical protein